MQVKKFCIQTSTRQDIVGKISRNILANRDFPWYSYQYDQLTEISKLRKRKFTYAEVSQWFRDFKAVRNER